MKLLLSLLAFTIAANSAYAVNSQKTRLFPLLSKRLSPQAEIAPPAPALDSPSTVTPQTPAGPKVLYYGGPVIASPEVYTVYWGSKVNKATQAAMPDLYNSLLQSNYMDVLKQYSTAGVAAVANQNGPGTQTFAPGKYVKTITITPLKTLSTKILDETLIRAEIERQIVTLKKLPVPNANTLFMIHFPAGLTITTTDGTTVASSCKEFCAFHGGYKSTATNGNIYYGVMPDLSGVSCTGCQAANSVMAGLTVSASHELMEAITDGIPTPGNHPDFPQAWNDSEGNEVGDLCESFAAQLTSKLKKTYIVQQIWDNKANACSTIPTYVAQ